MIPLQAADMLAYGVALDCSDIEYPKEEVTLQKHRSAKILNQYGWL